MNHLFSMNHFYFDNRKLLSFLILCALSFCAMSLRAESITLQNAGFEAWTDSLPDHWYGSASNIDSSAVSPSEDAFAGKYACRLVKTQKTHARLSSQPFALKAGYYKLSYYAKGEGSIRNSYHKGSSYDAYTEYVELVDDGWKKIEYVFHVKADLKEVQLIFSVASTSKAGILVDELTLETTEKPDALEQTDAAGIEFLSKDGALQVYADKDCWLEVFDLVGQSVLKTRLSQGFSTFEMKPGVYLLSVDKSAVTQKVMIRQ